MFTVILSSCSTSRLFVSSGIFVLTLKSSIYLFGPCLGIRCKVGIQLNFSKWLLTCSSDYHLLKEPLFPSDLKCCLKVPYVFSFIYSLFVFTFIVYSCASTTLFKLLQLSYNSFYSFPANSLSYLPKCLHPTSLLSSSPFFYSW